MLFSKFINSVSRKAVWNLVNIHFHTPSNNQIVTRLLSCKKSPANNLFIKRLNKTMAKTYAEINEKIKKGTAVY